MQLVHSGASGHFRIVSFLSLKEHPFRMECWKFYTIPGLGMAIYSLQMRYRDAVTASLLYRDSKKQDPQASSLGPLQIPCAFLCPLFQDTLMGLTRKKMTLAPDPQAVDCSLVACSRKALGM